MVIMDLRTVKKWKVMARMVVDSRYDDNWNPDKCRHNVTPKNRECADHRDEIADQILDWVAVPEISCWHWGV